MEQTANNRLIIEFKFTVSAPLVSVAAGYIVEARVTSGIVTSSIKLVDNMAIGTQGLQ